ncbi:MAG: YggS family pyridoxal phosphate enzyme [Gemmatimonadota bacterium]|nr:MAG: YggS family pyridoxal phosphate enzyme [Gemmatimonadota bacterium]
MSRVGDNFRRVRERIDQAAVRAGREGREVSICAVTKRVGLPAIREAVEAGARILGENRVQEAGDKIPEASDLAGRVQWHLIGPLQRNKARRAVTLFDAFQAVHSVALARKLADLGREQGREIPILLEVLTSDEGTKAGLPIVEVPEAAAEVSELNGLSLQGLMTMAPFTSEEGPVRSSFAALRGLRERCGKPDWELSMGMTGDFEIAVEEGSTLVRIGTGIFG